MAIRASGSRQVRAMEVTLGGRLSKAAAKRPGAELARHVRERLARRKAHWNELKPLLAQARAPFVELLKKDKRSVASAGALRAAFTRREQKPHAKARPPELQIEPRMVGSGLTVKVPPYDNDGEWGSGEVTDPRTGSRGNIRFKPEETARHGQESRPIFWRLRIIQRSGLPRSWITATPGSTGQLGGQLITMLRRISGYGFRRELLGS